MTACAVYGAGMPDHDRGDRGPESGDAFVSREAMAPWVGAFLELSAVGGCHRFVSLSLLRAVERAAVFSLADAGFAIERTRASRAGRHWRVVDGAERRAGGFRRLG